jgi:heat-inducible transcriptional repressor
MEGPHRDSPPLDERERLILKGIIEDYIASGAPVGSQHLTARVDVSSATIRNVMMDLESQGLLEKAHTSSGRRPTDAGYRYYVDTLLTMKAPARGDRQRIQRTVGGTEQLATRMADASQLLHELSRHAGVVATPRPTPTRLRQIDLLRIRGDRILAVLVTPEGLVHNKFLQVDFEASPEDLRQATQTLNQLLQGSTVDEVHARLSREVSEGRAAYDQFLNKALGLVERALSEVAPAEVIVSGQSTLLASPDLDLDRARALFAALEEKKRLLRILEQAASAGELQIYIGAESELGDVVVVASPYGVEGQVLGTVGVIGPLRMDYAKVIPLVEFTAKAVSKVLGGET